MSNTSFTLKRGRLWKFTSSWFYVMFLFLDTTIKSFWDVLLIWLCTQWQFDAIVSTVSIENWKGSCSNCFVWPKVVSFIYLFIYLLISFIYFFEDFNLPHFNEVSLLCHRIDLSVLSVALDPLDKMYILLGELSNFIRICIT